MLHELHLPSPEGTLRLSMTWQDTTSLTFFLRYLSVEHTGMRVYSTSVSPAPVWAWAQHYLQEQFPAELPWNASSLYLLPVDADSGKLLSNILINSQGGWLLITQFVDPVHSAVLEHNAQVVSSGLNEERDRTTRWHLGPVLSLMLLGLSSPIGIALPIHLQPG